MMQKNINHLLEKYNKGLCNPHEQAIVESWFLSWEEGEAPSEQNIELARKELYKALPKRSSNINLWKATTAAAIIFIAFGVGMHYYRKQNSETRLTHTNDIAPGQNIATLTYDNGTIIPLNQSKNGVIINATSLKYSDGTVIKQTDNYKGIQTIRTPKGGQYQITLPDGTKVWLNAASILKFSKDFNSSQRKVELNGEAYFEVTKSYISLKGLRTKQSFIVQTGNQSVEVLGTHFNICSYPNEPSTKTTLLEGSVRVFYTTDHSEVITKLDPTNRAFRNKKSILLTPGYQSINFTSKININKVDIEEAIAWKNGRTEFADADLKTVLRMLERWYNVETTYKTNIPQTLFSGSVSRSKNISEVLNLLETTGEVHFKIEGRRIIVTK